MEISEIINRLENLQGHCISMIDKDDPESIWAGDAEALRQAIELIKTPKALNINKFQNGGINMSETQKTQVAVRTPNGHVEDLRGDTALVFIIEKAGEFLDGSAKMVEGKVIYSGTDIPEPIFAETIGSLVASFIEQRSKSSSLEAAFNLHEVSQILEAKSQQIRRKLTPDAMLDEFDKTLNELFERMKNK